MHSVTLLTLDDPKTKKETPLHHVMGGNIMEFIFSQCFNSTRAKIRNEMETYPAGYGYIREVCCLGYEMILKVILQVMSIREVVYY